LRGQLPVDAKRLNISEIGGEATFHRAEPWRFGEDNQVIGQTH
jgi:hypothetical protein